MSAVVVTGATVPSMRSRSLLQPGGQLLPLRYGSRLRSKPGRPEDRYNQTEYRDQAKHSQAELPGAVGTPSRDSVDWPHPSIGGQDVLDAVNWIEPVAALLAR